MLIGAQRLPMVGSPEQYINNTCILADTNGVAFSMDFKAEFPAPSVFMQQALLANNTFYAPGGKVGYNGPGPFKTYEEFQAAGYDTTSKVSADVPSVDTIMAWARARLPPLQQQQK
jgi:hypothetical protein